MTTKLQEVGQLLKDIHNYDDLDNLKKLIELKMKILRDEVFFKQELWGFMHPDPPVLQQFIEAKIETTEDKEQELRLDEIFFEFQNWVKQEKGKNAKCPSRKRVKDELNATFGNQTNPNNRNSWIGIKIKETETMSYEDKKAFIAQSAKARKEANVSLK